MVENEEQKGDESPVLQLATLVNRLEEANKKAEENLKRQAELIALSKIGGQSDAGVQAPKPVEETPQEYVKRLMSGKK